MDKKAFDGKVAIVTGAGQGIGFEISRQLAGRGAAVILNDIDAGLATRRHFIETFADSGTILLAAHFPDPTGGRVVRRDGGSVFEFLEK